MAWYDDLTSILPTLLSIGGSYAASQNPTVAAMMGGGQTGTTQGSSAGTQQQAAQTQQQQQMNQQQTQNMQQTQNTQQQQNVQQQNLLNALQNLTGTGSTAQQTQWGLAPQDPYATAGQQGMLGNLQSGYQNTPLTQGLNTAASGLASTMPQYSTMLFNPAASQGAQSAIQGMTGAATNLYDTLMKPQIDTQYSRTGLFGSSPWAAERARGASSLSANLGGQAAGIYGQQQQLGQQGMSSFLPQLTQAAGVSEQYNPWSQTMPYWAALTKTGAPAVQMGTTGSQQYGQSGTSQQTGTGSTIGNMTGTGTSSALGTLLGSATGTGTSQSAGQGQQAANFSNQLGAVNVPSIFGGFQQFNDLLGQIKPFFG